MKSCNTMVAVFVFATLSGASGFSMNRFLEPAHSLMHAKEDAMQMWAVSNDELREASKEEVEASNGLADGKAIEEVAADNAKVEVARAKKELKGEDLDAALAVAHDEEARKVKDAQQMEDVAAKEQKDAEHTKKEGAQVRQDSTAIETAVMPLKMADIKKEDAKQMRIVADIEEREASEEAIQALHDKEDGEAIEKAAALTAKSDEARAAKELSTKNDRDAAVAVAQDEQNREDKDAKQIEDIATKETTDAADTIKDAKRMRKDAAALEVAVAKKK